MVSFHFLIVFFTLILASSSHPLPEPAKTTARSLGSLLGELARSIFSRDVVTLTPGGAVRGISTAGGALRTSVRYATIESRWTASRVVMSWDRT